MIKTRHGDWSFPKGHIEADETEVQTARREILEETGVEAEIDPSFRVCVPSAREGDRRTVTFFLGRFISGSLRPQIGEVSEVKWFPAYEAAYLIGYAPDREAYLQALKEVEK